MTSEDQIKAVLARHIKPWEMDGFPCVTGIPEAAAEIAALASTAGARAGDWVTVPRDAPEAMWGGLARQIVMWCRFGQPTGKALFQHLKSSGYEIPAWLREEVEDVDHVPPKGTVAVIIYRAMIEAAPAVPASPRSGSETASPPAPAEHGVEIRAISEHQLRELSALADWLERDSSENDADNIRAAVSALSQGGGAGRSEKGEGEEVAGYLNLYQYSDGTIVAGRRPLYRDAEEARSSVSEGRRTYLGVFALVRTAPAPAQSPSTSGELSSGTTGAKHG